MKTRKIAALLCAVITAFCAVSCQKSDSTSGSGTNSAAGSSSAESSAPEEEITAQSIKPTSEYVKSLGRTYTQKNKLYCTLSGTGAAFTFTGTECSVTITGDSTADGTTNLARIGIYVNGERVIDEMMDEEKKVFSVFKSDKEQDVEVRIVKLTEAPMSSIAIKKIDIVGKNIKPAENKARYIEFIGDSVTCGYGVDDEDRNHHFSTETEDCTKAYAYKTAENLDADYSLVCFSGHGIISGYTGNGKKVTAQTVPQYYTTCGYTYGTIDGIAPKSMAYDFSRQPDVVVLFLGINDDSYCKSKEERCEEYRAEYVNFLKTIHEKNPNAQIVCCMGIMSTALYPTIEKAVQDFTAETGYNKITSILFDQQQEADGIAADWHPTEKTHAKAADALTAKIKEVMGW